MSFKRFISILVCLFALFTLASAQSSIPLKKQGETYSSGTLRGATTLPGSLVGRTDIIGTKMDVISDPSGKLDNLEDERFKALEIEMKEKEWNHEDTAWERACALGDEAAFRKYLAMYPYGAHSGEANARIIDIQVNDALNNAHNELPNFELIEKDEDSPTSTIIITNHTNYPLTVLYSGENSRSIVIAAYQTSSITVRNGYYKIAASVPNTQVRPYAGTATLEGGKYQTGYYIVRY